MRSLWWSALSSALAMGVLEACALWLRDDLPARSLFWLALGTACASMVPLMAASTLLAGIRGTLTRRHARERATRRNGRRAVFGLLCLASAATMQAANTWLYVRLYSEWHTALSVVTLATLLAAFEFIGPPPTGHGSPSHRTLCALAAGAFALWLGLTTLSLARLLDDEVYREHATERTSTLAWELGLLDGATGVLGTREVTGAPEEVDTMGIVDQLTPRPIDTWSRAASGANVILITVDSLRADRWLQGERSQPLPAIEALGAQSARFTRAYAPSCWTVHSMSALMSSQPSSRLGFTAVSGEEALTLAGMNAELRARADVGLLRAAIPSPAIDARPRLVNLLRQAGYQTMTVPDNLNVATLTRDFEVISTLQVQDLLVARRRRAGRPLVTAVAQFLESRDRTRPFFIWLHFLEAHEPYEANEELRANGSDRARYDDALRAVDGAIGRLRSAVADQGLADQTLWVLHADHGEEFRDHGGQYHSSALYEETVHVPLLIRLPRAPASARRTVTTPVSLLDVTPTLLDLLGIETQTPWMGRSLTPALFGKPMAERPIILECEYRGKANLRGLLRWPLKIIRNRDTNTTQLYALDRDPAERHNLAQSDPERLATLKAQLQAVEHALLRNLW